MVRALIELPAGRPVAGLLAAARPLPSDWQRGIVFPSNGCIEPLFKGWCWADFASGDVPSDPSRPGDGPSFMPTTIRQGAECSTLDSGDGTRLQQVAAARLDYSREWALGRLLQTGENTDHDPDGDGNAQTNPALNDVAASASGLAPVDALACLEQGAADSMFGAPAFIHVPPGVATYLAASQAIWRDGTRWRTATGNVVVVSPGYQGVDMYATGEVFASTGFRETLPTEVDRTINNAIAWADEIGLAAFDPCWQGRVGTDVTLCGS